MKNITFTLLGALFSLSAIAADVSMAVPGAQTTQARRC